jgi:hypothetical protein
MTHPKLSTCLNTAPSVTPITRDPRTAARGTPGRDSFETPFPATP